MSEIIYFPKFRLTIPNLGFSLYYMPINILSLDTVDFTECDPMLRITMHTVVF